MTQADYRAELTASTVAWRDGRLIVIELTGTRHVTGRVNPASTTCAGATTLPFTYSVVATLRS